MTRFITLARLTDASIGDVGGLDHQTTVVTTALASEHIQGALGEMYWTLGSRDLVVVSEFETAERASAFALVLREALRAEVETLMEIDAKAVDTATAPARMSLGRPAFGRPAFGRGETEPEN